MAAPRSLSRPQIQPRSKSQNQGRVPRKGGDASKPASTKEADSQQSVQEREDPPLLKGHGRTSKKSDAKGKQQVGDEENLQNVDAHGKRNSAGFATGFDADELDVRARNGVKTGAVSGTSPLLPHSPAALMHRLQAPKTGEAPRNRVNDLAAFAATEQNGDLDTFGAALFDLVEKVEAGAYRNRDLRIPLSKLDFPKDKDLFALFAEDANPSSAARRPAQDVSGERHALLDLMQRLSDHCGDAVLLPSWPIRVRELNALWQMQGAFLGGDVDKVASWAKKLIEQTPGGPFASYAKAQLETLAVPMEAFKKEETEVAALAAIQKSLRPGGDVEKLCKGMKKIASRVEKGAGASDKSAPKNHAALTPAEIELEIAALPNPGALDVTALWTDAGDALREDFHQGLASLAAHHPDVQIYEEQTLKEASMYANVLEMEYSLSQGKGTKSDLLDVTQAFVEAFPHSERSQWITQLAIE